MDTSVAFSARASLVAVGLRFQPLGIWSIIAAHVHLKQKVRVHTPLEKLLDCFISILAGGHGLIEINTRVRADPSSQLAFGRMRWAEPSTVSRTLHVCTTEHITQLRQAIQVSLRQHSQRYRHDYEHAWPVLDVTVSGMLAGRLGEGVTKGYFAKQPNKRGRQLGRVLATRYDEIIVDRLYTGKHQLNHSLQELLRSAEVALALAENRRKRTILRIAGGGGTDDDVDWMLRREYHLLVKVKSWQRARKRATSVRRWLPDSKVAEREVGWLTEPHGYAKPTRQVAIRTRKLNGDWSYHVLVFMLSDDMLFDLGNRPMPAQPLALDILWAALHAYDRRGGGVETQHKGDQQGLGLTHRNKHRFNAQAMLVLLAQLAHDVLIWTRNDLARVDQDFQQ